MAPEWSSFLHMQCRVGGILTACLVSALSACGGSDADQPRSKDELGTWKTLISGDWTLPASSEGYTCVRQTVQEDLFVSGFDAIKPLGTHHTLLTMGDPDGQPDGISKCTAGTNHMRSAFGSGVGTNPIHFPPGIAMKIPKGTQLLLNLHLFNTSSSDLSGTSGTRIQTMPESEVEQIAEGILAGTIALSIPPGETTKHTGTCTMSSDATLFAVAPHMHQLGIYERVVAESSLEGTRVLYDGPYRFDEQSYTMIPALRVAKGDTISVECTHHNTTSALVKFGESTLSEMCFAGLYRYPADGSVFICVR